MYGPLQFKINRGTGLKWLDLMENTDWVFEGSQLSFEFDGKTFGSPEGILASIVYGKEVTLSWDGSSHLYAGNQFYIDSEGLKRLKVKGKIPEFDSFEEAKSYLKDVLDFAKGESSDDEMVS